MSSGQGLPTEQFRKALIAAGNERVQSEQCAIHHERAFLAAAANPSYIVISGRCYTYI